MKSRLLPEKQSLVHHRPNLRNTRGVIAIAVIAAALFPLAYVLLRTPSQPVEVTLLEIEPARVRDNAGEEISWVTLGIYNRSSAELEFARNKTFHAKIKDRWIELPEVFYLDRLGAKAKTEISLSIPAGADTCRLPLKYQRPKLVWRLWSHLSPRTQQLLWKSPRYLSWLLPKGKPLPYPPEWKPLMVEVPLRKKPGM